MIVSEFSSAQFMNSFSIWPEFHSLLDAVVQSMSPLDCRAVEACSLEWRITRLYLAVHWRSLKVSRRAVLVWPSVKVGGGGVMVCGCFSGLGSLVLLKGTLNASAYWDILDNFSSQLCGSSLGMAPSCTDMTAHRCTRQRPYRHHIKPCRLWKQCHSGSYPCEGRWVNTFGSVGMILHIMSLKVKIGKSPASKIHFILSTIFKLTDTRLFSQPPGLKWSFCSLFTCCWGECSWWLRACLVTVFFVFHQHV